MTPTPQEPVLEECGEPKSIPKPMSGEEVVISGMSGIFPNSDNVQSFMENLFNKVDMVSHHDRWVFNHPEVPRHLGIVNGIEKFDAQFFRVHFKQACVMEAMSRKLLEHAYASIFDAGINPLQLRGKKVGVFIGSTFSESEKIVIYETIQRNGFGITGCNKSMYANRISYWIDGKGPSYALDVACASSMACLEHAYRAMSSGQCDAAIVGGCNLCMHPCVSLNLKRAGFLCLDGKTKCFDKKGDGYVRSDAISVLFLQKAKDANRIYTEVYHAKGNYKLRRDADFLPSRDTKIIKEFLEEFYSEIDVSPKEVEFVEACGSGIAEADGNELEAIGQIFGKEKPVKVGSVKSNMGNSEPASGVCAVTKVCLAYEKGEIPANLHYEEPQDHLAAIKQGQVEVLTDHAKFNRTYTALNTFSYSGANIHVLFKGHYKEKNLNQYDTTIPRLVVVSGRQESCVDKIHNELKSKPIDAEEIGLLQNIHRFDIPGHMCRGFIILGKNDNETVSLVQHHQYYDALPRPLWFVYSGMGSQWAGMGAELLKIPVFAAAIERCRKTLEPKGLDLIDILTNPDKTIYDNILHSFVGIAAVQIGLTDVLKSMGIVPDFIIGHSVGELGCAYADGCFTAEEMILAAYSRGLVSLQTPLIKGSMAAVGLSYREIQPMCPPEIEVACHNSAESSTISGPADIMKEFVAELTKKKIFAKEVPCSNIAYHSRYIAGAGPGLLKYLKEVIKDPKPRSNKWVSTSVPEEKWTEESAKYSSAEYHTNNLLNPVLFEETSSKIPAHAIVVEIAPHGLLQAIIKRSLPDAIHIPLTRRGHADPVKYFLESIGKLYEAGQNPDVSALYPKIEFPVSTGTPLLSHLVEWEHSEVWPSARYYTKDKTTAFIRSFVMSVHDDDYEYVQGYVRNGINIFPEAALLVLVWETFAMQKELLYTDMPVTFTDVTFHETANIISEKPLNLGIMIHKGNNKFEIQNQGVLICSGTINEKDNDSKLRELEAEPEDENQSIVKLNGRDIYKTMYYKGYNYQGVFKSIHSATLDYQNAEFIWRNDWVTFIDSILQLNVLSQEYDGVSAPMGIKKLIVDVKEHEKKLITMEDGIECYEGVLNKTCHYTQAGGVLLENIIFSHLPVSEDVPNVVTVREFVPNFLIGQLNVETVFNLYLQVIEENISNSKIKVVDINTIEKLQLGTIIDVLSQNMPSTEFKIKHVKSDYFDINSIVREYPDAVDADVFITNNILNDEKKMLNLHNRISAKSFVISLEPITIKLDMKHKYFNMINALRTKDFYIVLLKKIVASQNENVIYLPVTEDTKFDWVPYVEKELQRTRKVILVSEKRMYRGVNGLVKALRKNFGNKVGLVVIDDVRGPTFSPDKDIYREQLEKDMAFNILRKSQWGSFYQIPASLYARLENVTLTNLVPGDLNSLTWIEQPISLPSNNLVEVHYAALSYRDAQIASGRVPKTNNGFGMDFSGLNSRGERVMGFIKGDAVASTVEAEPLMTWPVPEHWTLEEAATVPLPYVFAYYLLTVKDSLLKGKNVFVHGGCGGIGQAVISVCLALDCNVYTTVSSVEKKQFLCRLFPKLDESHIGNSRDPNFLNNVMTGTQGQGCDVTINCTTGLVREMTMRCCGMHSVFFDINQEDMLENKKFGMYFVMAARHYYGVNITNVFDDKEVMQDIQFRIAEGISKGIIRPLTRVTYPASQINRAFRLLSSTNHRGRVIIKMRDENQTHEMKVTPRLDLSSSGTFVVVCDEDGVGVELADRLVKRGVRSLMIHIQSEFIDEYFLTKIASWRQLEVTVKVSSKDLETEKGCLALLSEAIMMGPVVGVLILQMSKASPAVTREDFANKFKETALVVANLDLASQNVCSELRHFVVITEATDDYTLSYANSASENICLERSEVGLPALYFQIGLLDKYGEQDNYVKEKIRAQSLRSVFNAIESSLKLNYHNVTVSSVQNTDDMLAKVAQIFGANNIAELPQNVALEKFRVSRVIFEEIRMLIKETIGILYPIEKVEEMTLTDLQSLKQTTNIVNSKFDSGLGAFYTFIDEDECLATEPLMPMPSILSNATEKEEELDPKAAYLMLIPGFEGHHRIFTSITQRLKLNAMTFQLGPDMPLDSVHAMALNIKKFMKQRFEIGSKFYLLGYSFGVNVALELAALMEKEGHVGIVFCLDSSPDALKVQLDAYLGNLTENDLENAIIEHMYTLMAGGDTDKLRKDLRETEEWSEKVEVCVKYLIGSVHYSIQYMRSLLDSAYKRIILSKNYKCEVKLESEVILLKGIPHPRAQGLDNDYNLSKYSKQPVKVFDVHYDHATCLQDCRVSNIINRHLSPEILEEFKKRNLCETYTPDLFRYL